MEFDDGLFEKSRRIRSLFRQGRKIYRFVVSATRNGARHYLHTVHQRSEKLNIANRQMQQETHAGPWQRRMGGVISDDRVANFFELVDPMSDLVKEISNLPALLY
ncbi:hypothetical protein RRF57_012481 [Xylaria bambusicola]|uniref:Uncharacterized protein n=1 Tax=Xylaria bambusicola TaxID=326684 RepID=A0AAN7V5N9_9PEZI